ncbi:MAG TPA: hypothetical protein VGN23_01695 [Verrucomicrobiae bacterium]|jgi:hypothetical protein
MKTRLKLSVCDFRLKLPAYDDAYYVRRALKLEAALKQKPKVLRLELIGEGEVPADTTLLIRSILLGRAPGTELVTNARSSLQGGSVLVWLMGDRRTIREDARVFFKRNPLADENLVEVYAGLGEPESKYKDSYSSFDPADADYARVLKLIDEYLPVRQFAGRVVSVNLLREFGLVENRPVGVSSVAAPAKSAQAMVST